MAIETDLTVSPYFESNQEDNYYKVLFKPSVPVQVRELNQLQKMLQNQIEEFGDNILKRGTIIRGCSFTFYNNYPYVKIKDNTVAGVEANPSLYLNSYVKNSSNLVAYVSTVDVGFEATTPDLKTLYIKYLNSGSNGSVSTFAQNEELTVYNPNNTIEDVSIVAGGSNYSNNDSLYFVSALVVQNTSSLTFGNGSDITQSTSNSRATIVEVNTSIFSDKTVLKIKPIAIDLANTQLTDSIWTFQAGPADTYSIRDGSSNATAQVLEVIGSGAEGSIITDSIGKVVATQVTSKGSGYYVNPYAAVKPTSGGASANVVAENYIDKVTVSGLEGSVGSGYAFGVSDGVIYQKGYFVDVAAQVVVVEKYSRFPNNVAVGFRTEEELISSLQDPNLLDNALGTPNYTAPGADRLKLTPVLDVLTVDEALANSEFLSLVEFSSGVPYKQNPRTVYNQIGDEMALRTKEESGDYVLDSFLVATTSSTNTQIDANTFTIAVDPGTAYISGYRIQTLGNKLIDVSKGIDVQTTNNASVSLNFGSYIKINNLAGNFPFATGASVDLYDTAVRYTSNVDRVEGGTITPTLDASFDAKDSVTSASDFIALPGNPFANGDFVLYYTATGNTALTGLSNNTNYFVVDANSSGVKLSTSFGGSNINITASASNETGHFLAKGQKIGTARVRSLYFDEGSVGTGEDEYFLYIYDVQMNSGRVFADTRAVYSGGTNKGVADVVLTRDATTNTDIAVLQETSASDGTTMDKMLFYSGFVSPLSINNFSYRYRTIQEVNGMANTGLLTIALTGSDYWPYSNGATLSTVQKKDIYIAPLNNLQANANIAGTISSFNSNTLITGSGTSFLSTFAAGDYIYLSNGSHTDLRRVTSVSSDTQLNTDANSSFSFSAVNASRYFPKHIPIPVSSRAGITANVSSNKRTLTIDLGTRLSGNSNVAVVAAYSVNTENLSISQKTPNRTRYVKIRPGNNSTGFSLTGIGTANGTISLSAGSNAVTGTSTFFSRDFTAGDIVEVKTIATTTQGGISVPGGTAFINSYFTVGTITNNTNMTFTTVSNFTDSTSTVRKAGNLDGPWCLGVPDVFRLRAVYLSDAATVNTDSFDVTSSFYIDHNQTQNYYGLSYLVKNKDSKLVIQPTDYLLVEFDAFTSTGTTHHINSYVDNVANNRFTTDSQPLSNLSSSYKSLNTFEIPQMMTKQGQIYDLVNQLDFRPYAEATATLATSASTANLNPLDTISFNSDDKKFPEPDADAVFNITEFLGRIDSVVVDKTGKISVLKGQPITDDTLFNSFRNVDSIPERAPDTILLNNLRIPSYPNTTEIISSVVRDFVDTGVINEKYLQYRNISKKITKLFTTIDIQDQQPSGYTMEDIGNLERRISVLEYYVALTLLELQIKDKIIPSSLSPNINRFKYGFFTDDFSSTAYTDVNNSEYSADIVKGRLIPSSEMIEHPYDDISCNCTPYLIVAQDTATGSANVTSTVSYNTLERQTSDKSKKGRGTPATYFTDTVDITMASDLGSNSGLVSVYCYFHGAFDKMEIYQSNTPGVFSNTPIYSTNNAVALSNTDINFMRTFPLFTVSISESDLRKHTIGSSGGVDGFLKNGGKISFNHSPSAGRFYRITVKKGQNSYMWKYLVQYPVNATNNLGSGCNITTPQPQKYIGVIVPERNFEIDLKAKNNSSKKKNWEEEEYKVSRITCRGLKPNTKHKFFVNKTDLTSKCDTTIEKNLKDVTFDGTASAWLSSIGLGLTDVMTNEKGVVAFDLFLDSTQFNNLDKLDGKKDNKFFLEIYNTDQSSYAAGKLEFKSRSNNNQTRDNGNKGSGGGGVTASPDGKGGTSYKDSAGNPASGNFKGNW